MIFQPLTPLIASSLNWLALMFCAVTPEPNIFTSVWSTEPISANMVVRRAS